jgi:sialic acid synthase SpsE
MSEKSTKTLRRSLFVVKNIKKGETGKGETATFFNRVDTTGP